MRRNPESKFRMLAECICKECGKEFVETYPLGSLRQLTSEKPETEILGSLILYKFRFWLDYTRDTS